MKHAISIGDTPVRKDDHRAAILILGLAPCGDMGKEQRGETLVILDESIYRLAVGSSVHIHQ